MALKLRIWRAVFRRTWRLCRIVKQVNENRSLWARWRWYWRDGWAMLEISPDGDIWFGPF
jgi:hypothetical protein